MTNSSFQKTTPILRWLTLLVACAVVGWSLRGFLLVRLVGHEGTTQMGIIEHDMGNLVAGTKVRATENENRRINPPQSRVGSARPAGLNEEGKVAFDWGQTLWCTQVYPCDKVTKCTIYQGSDPDKFGKYYCAQDNAAAPLGGPVGWTGRVLKGRYCWGT
jgi:hypothetical protein